MGPEYIHTSLHHLLCELLCTFTADSAHNYEKHQSAELKSCPSSCMLTRRRSCHITQNKDKDLLPHARCDTANVATLHSTARLEEKKIPSQLRLFIAFH